MTRAVLLGLVAAAGTFFMLAFVAAVLTDSAADTLEQTSILWLALCTVAGLAAGFLGDRLARPAPAASRAVVVSANSSATAAGPAIATA